MYFHKPQIVAYGWSLIKMSKNTIQNPKTRSDTLSLTLHKTGQYCKKIKGKIQAIPSMLPLRTAA